MSDRLAERYKHFIHEVTHQFRYRLSSTSEQFLSDVIDVASNNIFQLEQGTFLYRARANDLEHCGDIKQPKATPRPACDMKPAPNVVSEGRANPDNICALYLADHAGTALAEVRAGTRYPVTVGTFKTTRDLQIVDLTKVMDWYSYFFDPPTDGNDLWHDLSYDFSKPLNAHETRTHYAKTQIIAEAFKRHGFDGVRYRSQFFAHEQTIGSAKISGTNYALFDLQSAVCEECVVYQLIEQHAVYQQHKP